jgi:hypothetical protein
VTLCGGIRTKKKPLEHGVGALRGYNGTYITVPAVGRISPQLVVWKYYYRGPHGYEGYGVFRFRAPRLLAAERSATSTHWSELLLENKLLIAEYNAIILPISRR